MILMNWMHKLSRKPQPAIMTKRMREARSSNQSRAADFAQSLLSHREMTDITLHTDFHYDPKTGYTTCQAKITHVTDSGFVQTRQGSAVDGDWQTAMYYALFTAYGNQLDLAEYPE